MPKTTTIKDTSNNVVVFPKSNNDMPPQSVEELKKKIVESRMEIAQVLAEEITKENIRIMVDNGYHINHFKDVTFLLVVLKSILLRHENVHHPFQKIIDENILLDEEFLEDETNGD
jgi:hypothetical protein